jgi:Fe-Mn family superoxide dismutase
MAYTLPDLPYPYDHLEPSIDAKTMEIHHDKHHAAYVTNLNKAMESAPELAKQDVDTLIMHLDKVPEAIRGAVRNNGGGHSNHSMFWRIMNKGKGGHPSGKLGDAIKADIGGFDKFKEEFTKAALTRFGSGWAWLSLDKAGKLIVESTPNQDSPLMSGNSPIIGIDVWEHAYYLKYQNRRADYIAAWWNVVDWDAANERYAKHKK